jgi:hypothetical protein
VVAAHFLEQPLQLGKKPAAEREFLPVHSGAVRHERVDQHGARRAAQKAGLFQQQHFQPLPARSHRRRHPRQPAAHDEHIPVCVDKFLHNFLLLIRHGARVRGKPHERLNYLIS